MENDCGIFAGVIVVHMALLLSLANGSTPCTTRCPNAQGNIEDCALVSPKQLIADQRVISQLQCFDACIREMGCRGYNYRHHKVAYGSCRLFRGLWSFSDESKLVAENGTVFTWIQRDRYKQWLSPMCLGSQPSLLSINGSCRKPLDIAFLLDSSTHNVESFNLEKQFIARVMQIFDQSSEYTKAATVEYSTTAATQFTFNNFTTAAHFTNYLDGIPYIPAAGKTRYDRALYMAEANLFASQGGARPFVHRVVTLITDSKISSDAVNVYNLRDLKVSFAEKCVQMFAVGIDHGKVPAKEVAMSSEGHLLTVDFFNQLDAKADEFAKKICTALG